MTPTFLFFHTFLPWMWLRLRMFIHEPSMMFISARIVSFILLIFIFLSVYDRVLFKLWSLLPVTTCIFLTEGKLVIVSIMGFSLYLGLSQFIQLFQRETAFLQFLKSAHKELASNCSIDSGLRFFYLAVFTIFLFRLIKSPLIFLTTLFLSSP